jgi:hypothetical protein
LKYDTRKIKIAMKHEFLLIFENEGYNIATMDIYKKLYLLYIQLFMISF